MTRSLSSGDLATLMHGGLPARIVGELGLDTSQGRWVSEAGGVLYAVGGAVLIRSPEREAEAERLLAAIAGAVEADDAPSAVAARAALGAGSSKTSTAERLGLVLLSFGIERLKEGRPLVAGCHELIERLPEDPGGLAAAILASAGAWRRLCKAVHALVASVSTLYPVPGETADAVRAQDDAWLRWSRRTKGGVKFSWLLLNLTRGDIEAVRSTRGLDEKLRERGGRPSDWNELLGSLVLRTGLAADEEERHDIRSLPVAKLVRAWASVRPNAQARSLGAWLDAVGADVRQATAAAWTGRLPPNLRFDVREGAYVPLRGEEMATALRAPAWPTDVVSGPRGGGPRPVFPDSAGDRISVGLAFLINQDSENFASRVMPTVELWPYFDWMIRRWMDRWDAVPADASSKQASHGAGWRLTDGDRAWSASRLFIRVATALVRDDYAELLVPHRYLNHGDPTGESPPTDALLLSLLGFGAGLTATILKPSARTILKSKEDLSSGLLEHALFGVLPGRAAEGQGLARWAPAVGSLLPSLSADEVGAILRGWPALTRALLGALDGAARASVAQLAERAERVFDSPVAADPLLAQLGCAFLAGYAGGRKMGVVKARRREWQLRGPVIRGDGASGTRPAVRTSG